MRYRTRERWSLTLQVLTAVFVLPLVTSLPIIALIAYLHSQWWQVIPVMGYSTAYWGQAMLAAIGVPVFLLSHWIGRMASWW